MFTIQLTRNHKKTQLGTNKFLHTDSKLRNVNETEILLGPCSFCAVEALKTVDLK